MTITTGEQAVLAKNFISQLFVLGLFGRIVQILAILCLLNLNDYFTTPAQIPTLLPVGTLIILLLVVVAIADAISTRICRRLVERLDRIQHVYGVEASNTSQVSSGSEQRHYLRTVFFPLLTAVSPAPLLAIVLISTTPLLFVISLLQSAANAVIIRCYNRGLSQEVSDLLPPNSSLVSNQDEVTLSHLLRSFGVVKNQYLDIQGEGSSNPELGLLHRKKEALRTSHLVFRGVILITSVILAIYKLSSLSSVVGFFILNNTLRYAVIALAEYWWPAYRHLSFKQACELIQLALQSETGLLKQLEKVQARQAQDKREFDQRMTHRLNQKPYLRFRDFRVIGHVPSAHTILDGITARIELKAITLIHVNGVSLCHDLATLVADQRKGHCRADCQGVAVCGQLNIDINFWHQLPVADVQHNRVITTSLAEHFSPEHQSRLSKLIDDYSLANYYLEGDPEPLSIRHFSRRQMRRMCALMSLLDAVLQPHCLWLLPFVLESFEENERMELLDFYRRELSAQQRSIFLLSHPLPALTESHCSYELRRSSLKRCS